MCVYEADYDSGIGRHLWSAGECFSVIMHRVCVCVCMGMWGSVEDFFFPVEEIHIKTLHPSPTSSKREWIIAPVSGFFVCLEQQSSRPYNNLVVIIIC